MVAAISRAKWVYGLDPGLTVRIYRFVHENQPVHERVVRSNFPEVHTRVRKHIDFLADKLQLLEWKPMPHGKMVWFKRKFIREPYLICNYRYSEGDLIRLIASRNDVRSNVRARLKKFIKRYERYEPLRNVSRKSHFRARKAIQNRPKPPEWIPLVKQDDEAWTRQARRAPDVFVEWAVVAVAACTPHLPLRRQLQVLTKEEDGYHSKQLIREVLEQVPEMWLCWMWWRVDKGAKSMKDLTVYFKEPDHEGLS